MASDVSLKVAKMESDIQYIKEEVQDTKQIIREFIDKADSRYASKDTERMVKGLAAVILSAVLVAIVALVVV